MGERRRLGNSIQKERELILYQALGEPVGLLLVSSNPPRDLKVLYATKDRAADPELQRLQFRQVDLPDGNIAITKRSK